MVGNSCWPSGLTIMANACAQALVIMNTPLVTGLFAALNFASSERISSRMASASSPDDTMLDAPLVIEAGETPATAVFEGLMKSVSSRAANACTSWSRTTASELGLEYLTFSILKTQMLATFNGVNVVRVKLNEVNGFAADSPTQ